MIKNERQYRASRRKHAQLLEAASQASGRDRESYERLARRVAQELREYEALVHDSPDAIPVDGLDNMADALVKARLARGWTHRELADALDVSEQMVQRDEAGGYETAALYRVAEVAEALGFELGGFLEHKEHSYKFSTGQAGSGESFENVHKFTLPGEASGQRAYGSMEIKAAVSAAMDAVRDLSPEADESLYVSNPSESRLSITE